MPALTSTVLHPDETGTGEIRVLYSVSSVTTDDTLDVSEQFSKVKMATAVASGSGTPAVSQPDIDATFTILTFSDAGYDKDTVTLLVVGDAA